MKISRRTILTLLSGSVLFFAAKARVWLPRSASAAVESKPALTESNVIVVHLVETTMAAPDTICFEIRDQNIVKGGLHQIASSPPRGYKSVNGVYGEVVGPKSDWFRSFDSKPENYLDRTAIDDVVGWNSANPSGIGG